MGKAAAECVAELDSRLLDVQNTLSDLLGLFPKKAETSATCRYDRSHVMPPGAISAHEQKCCLKKAGLDPKEGYPSSYAAYVDGCPNVITLFLGEDTIKQIAADVQSNQRSASEVRNEHRPFDISDVEVVDESKKEVPLVDLEEGKPDLWNAIDDPVLKLWWIHEWQAIPQAQSRLPAEVSLLPHNQVRGWLFGNLPPLLLPHPGAGVDLVNHVSAWLHTHPSIDAETLLRELLPHLGSAAKGWILAVWKFVCMSIVEASSGVLFREIEDRPYNKSMLRRLTGADQARSDDVHSHASQPVAVRKPRPRPPPEMLSGIPHTIDAFTRTHPAPVRLAVYDHVIRATAPQRTLRQPVLSELQADAAMMTEGVKQDQARTVEQKMAGLRDSKRRSRSYRGARAAAKKPYTEVLRVVIYNRMGEWGASTGFGPDHRVVRARGWKEEEGNFETKTGKERRENRGESVIFDRERRGERERRGDRSREQEREGREGVRRDGRRESIRDEDGHRREKGNVKEEKKEGSDGNIAETEKAKMDNVSVGDGVRNLDDTRSKHRSSSRSHKDKHRHKKKKSHKETKESEKGRKRRHSSSGSEEGELGYERVKSVRVDGEEEGETRN